MRRRRLLLAAAATFVAAASLTPAAAATGRTDRASTPSRAAQSNGDTPAATVPDTTSPAMALDGVHLAFSSDATNLVPGDTNGAADVFIRDLDAGTITRVSVTRSGGQANGASYSPALSVDGRWLAFVSTATNLVPNDSNGVADVFLKNMRNGRVRRISQVPGAEANGASNTPWVSLFGEWITFTSSATNLGSGDDNRMPDAFLYTRRSRTLERIAPPALPFEGASPLVGWTSDATISYDGRFLAFARAATHARPTTPEIGTPLPVLPPVPTIPGAPDDPAHPAMEDTEEPVVSDVFILDRKKDRLRRVKLPRWGGRYRQLGGHPEIAADGRKVVFEVWSVVDPDSAADLIDPHHEPTPKDQVVRNPVDPTDVYFYDRVARALVPVSRNSYGQMGDANSTNPHVSSQGHSITFTSDATNLVAGDTNGATDVFVWDSRERATSRVSLGADGSEIAGASTRASMDYDARRIAFASAAPDVVAGDSNARDDVFVHDRNLVVHNQAPRLDPIKKVWTINTMMTTTMSLGGHDPDGDPLRYGIILVIPPNTTSRPPGLPDQFAVDPETGVFTWTPTINQTGPWKIVFWVADQRGLGDIQLARFVVRDAAQTAACTATATC